MHESGICVPLLTIAAFYPRASTPLPVLIGFTFKHSHTMKFGGCCRKL